VPYIGKPMDNQHATSLASEQSGKPANSRQEFQARLVLIATFLLLFGLATYVLYARGVFEPTHGLVLVTDDSEGVAVGMDLTFAGFPLGRVTRVELAEDGQARIVVSIPRKNTQWLKESSVFTIERSMIGSVRIRAYSGILSDPELPDGAERPLLRGDAFSEFQRLAVPMRELVEQLAAVSQRLQGPYGALGVLLGSDAEAQRVLETLTRVDRLIEGVNRQVLGLDGAADPGLVRTTRDMLAALSQVLLDSRESLAKVNLILEEGKVIAENARLATSDLDLLKDEASRNLRRIDSLLEEISRKWPFSQDAEMRLP